jgi:hypothetical protein
MKIQALGTCLRLPPAVLASILSAYLRATEQPIDTSTAAGKAFLDMLGPCAGDQALDFLGGQVFAGAARGMRNGLGRNCPILRDWRGDLNGGAAYRMRPLSHPRLSHSGAKMGQSKSPALASRRARFSVGNTGHKTSRHPGIASGCERSRSG